jgi:hypothetical protein
MEVEGPFPNTQYTNKEIQYCWNESVNKFIQTKNDFVGSTNENQVT